MVRTKAWVLLVLFCLSNAILQFFDNNNHDDETRNLQQSTSKDQRLMIPNNTGLTPRAFPQWTRGHAILCEQGQKNEMDDIAPEVSLNQGFLYIKPGKTGGSTTAGINLRIARNVAFRLRRNFTSCQANSRPGALVNRFPHIDFHKSFLWTMVREPTRRLQSAFFFFRVSRQRQQPRDAAYQRYVREYAHYYEDILRLTPKAEEEEEDPHVANETTTTTTIATFQQVLDQYNFIGITERYDESIVALQMILDLPIEDMLYLSSKTSGGYDDGGRKNQCTYIVPKFTSPGMQIVFASDEWQALVQHERAFYEAANRSLDLTIDALGRHKFHTKLAAFRQLRREAVRQCQDSVVFPCRASGEMSRMEERDCLDGDSGCGASCLDGVARDGAAASLEASGSNILGRKLPLWVQNSWDNAITIKRRWIPWMLLLLLTSAAAARMLRRAARSKGGTHTL